MKPLTEKEVLPELKRRIKATLADIQDKELHSDGWVMQGRHTIHFMLRNKDYLIKGIAMKRVE
jgi:hypothetical protein